MRTAGWLSYPQRLRIEYTEARVDAHRDGAYEFRVYASGPCQPVHPARSVPQYPMGADGHGSAGLPEISEDRASSVH